ncbi:MAG: DUF3365 domain-containing protein [Magnetococcales bacterium]|nr:DUF3365 domain-containing protein [Magnetococcales bacterium]
MNRYFVVAALLWTALVGGSLAWNIFNAQQQTFETVNFAARAHFQKDTAFRFWGASHGGVYVPITERTPPNPSLSHIPERDIETPSGRKLTLMNPAYMLRQLMSEYAGLYGARGRITSLKPLNPINAPDPWETKALKAFEEGVEEVLEVTTKDGAPHLRLMRPMSTKKICLKCHSHQGYEMGDIRGGVGVYVPMAPYLEIEKNAIHVMLWSHGLFWLLGLAGIAYGSLRRQQRLEEQHQAREALTQVNRNLTKSEKKYRSIIATTAEGFWLFSLENFRIQEVNDAICHMLGYGRSEIVGRRPPDFAHPENLPAMQAMEKSILDTDERKFNTVFLAKDGSHIHAQVHCTTVRDEQGRPEVAFAFITNVSDHKILESRLRQAKEEAETANQAKSAFLAHMSHEIRTPLNSILGMNELLLESEVTSRQRHYLETSCKASETLLSVVNDILDLSKIEAGQLDLEATTFDLPNLLSETTEILSLKAQDKGLRLVHEVDYQLPQWISGDPGRLRQVLLNLLGNAIKFTDAGEVVVLVKPMQESDIQFSVADTGIGIPAAKQEAIFQPFNQVDSSTTRQFGGTGLGLTICRRLIQNMGGDIWVESRAGEGSVFYFTIPLVQGTPQPASLSRGRAGNGNASLQGEMAAAQARGLAILLAEDAVDNRILIQAFLGKSSHTLEMAEDGLEALKKAQSGHYDLILMDIQMPGMDGYEATRKIRAWEKQQELEPTPIIALTAHAMKEAVKEAQASGCDYFLSKPIKKSRLLEVLDQFARGENPPQWHSHSRGQMS